MASCISGSERSIIHTLERWAYSEIRRIMRGEEYASKVGSRQWVIDRSVVRRSS
jgi:hypothetical protein